MSGSGNCYDNSAVESYFKSQKAKLIWRQNGQTRREVEIGGKLAQHGSRIIDSFVKKTSNQFFERFQAVVERHENDV